MTAHCSAPWGGRWRAGAVVFCVAFLATRAAALPGDNEHWSQVRTRNFILLGRSDPNDLIRTGLRLERFRAVLENGRAPSPESGVSPTTIIVFKDELCFAPYKRTADGKTAGYGGIFVPGVDRNYIGMNADWDDDESNIVFHEYVHFFLSHRYGDVPLWLHEGLAEYYSTCRMNKNEVDVGRPIDSHVQYLAEKPLMPLGDLFEMNTDSKDYSEGERQGVFYAESWALVHYLLLGNAARATQLQTFLDSSGGLISQPDAFTQAFGAGHEAMQQQLDDYVHNADFRYLHLKFSSLTTDETAEVLPLSRPELLYTLGDYVAHVTPWQVEAAEAHLREALRLDSSHARAHAALAALLAKRDAWPEAEEHFQKAIETGSADALPFYLYGKAQLERGMAHRRDVAINPGPLPESIQAARGLLARSVELAPNFAEASVALGCTYLYDPGDLTDGIAALDHARQLLPARMDIPHNLMMLCLRRGDRTSAETLANEVLLHSRDATIIADANQVLERYDQHLEGKQFSEGVAKLNAHDYTGGIAILESLRATTQNSELAGQIDKLLREVQAARQDDAKAAALNRQIDEYNVASQKTREGDYAGAMAILRRLAPQVTDPDLAKHVKQLTKDLRTALDATSPARR